MCSNTDTILIEHDSQFYKTLFYFDSNKSPTKNLTDTYHYYNLHHTNYIISTK